MLARALNFAWSPDFSIYASEAFLKHVGDDYGWIGGFDRTERLRCVLPYTIVRKASVRMVKFRVSTISLDEPLSIDEEKAFLNSVIDYLKSIGADLIVPGAANAIFRICPDGAVSAPYGNFVIDLTRSEDELWQSMHGKHRNVIRTTAKKGVEIRSGLQELENVHAIVKSTLQRSNLKFMSLDKFKQLVTSLGDHAKLFCAYHNGQIQSGAMFPFSRFSAYYLYGGNVPHPVTGAANLLQWEAMRCFQKLGVKRYDFVGARVAPEKGSKQEGIKMFKERFGGEFVTGYTWKYPFHPFKAWVYSLAVRIRGGDVVDAERRHSAGVADGGARPAQLPTAETKVLVHD